MEHQKIIDTFETYQRAKDTRPRGAEGGSSANVVHNKNFQSHKSKNKKKSDGKEKFDGKNKPSQSTNFKKKTDKRKGACHVCGKLGHWAPSCPNRFDKHHGKSGKTANVVIGDAEMKDSGYGILPTILSVCQSPNWWIDTDANVHVCSDISMFSSYQVTWTSSVLMGNDSHATVRGVCTVDLKHFRKDRAAKERASCSLNQ
jgi:hypothetical protein